jgi:hypothetical protein
MEASGGLMLIVALSALPCIGLTQIPGIRPIPRPSLPGFAFNCLLFQPFTGAP